MAEVTSPVAGWLHGMVQAEESVKMMQDNKHESVITGCRKTSACLLGGNDNRRNAGHEKVALAELFIGCERWMTGQAVFQQPFI